LLNEHLVDKWHANAAIGAKTFFEQVDRDHN
jgi:hypothetical protein